MTELRIVPPGSPKPTKVAIYGFTDHKNQGPLGVEGWENWGLNELYRYMPLDKFSRWFELHPRSDFEKPEAQGGDPAHIASLKTFGIPVYMTRHHDDIPASVELPRAMIEAGIKDKYVTSTPAWMLALAIAEGFEEIGLFGIDMAQDIEYNDQRPCMEYLIGLARGRGIRIVLPKVSDLCKAVAQYGFESEGSELMLKMAERIAWLDRELKNQESKLAGLEADYAAKSAQLNKQYADFKQSFFNNIAQIRGATDDVKYWMRSWGVRAATAPTAESPATPDRRGMRSGITVSPEDARAAFQPQGGDSKGVSAQTAPQPMITMPVGRMRHIPTVGLPGGS